MHYAAEKFAELRKAAGDDVDIAIDFHGAISPATAKLLIKAIEPYQPMFVEEPCQAQNHDVMAEIARGTHLPIATGERVFTKWGFREVLEKRAATILQPDLCHAGGITEVRLIAGMAEAYYAAIAPHNPLGPISLAAGIQIAASIPNFLCQEQVSLGVGYVKTPFTLRKGYLDLPTGPGLGIELDENAMADKIGHDWKNRECVRRRRRLGRRLVSATPPRMGAGFRWEGDHDRFRTFRLAQQGHEAGRVAVEGPDEGALIGGALARTIWFCPWLWARASASSDASSKRECGVRVGRELGHADRDGREGYFGDVPSRLGNRAADDPGNGRRAGAASADQQDDDAIVVEPGHDVARSDQGA